jgi:NAD(P)-dependent dehydrogenase (short-subunit alcohol dehydrogenase family)
MRLKDKVALITGASGGLGRSFCKAFLNEGAKVWVTDISKELVQDTVAELNSPDSLLGTIVDVCQRDTIETAVSTAVKRFGHLD